MGLLLEFPALLAAFASAGAGHGDYVMTRALFPVPMLLTLGSTIGPLSLGLGFVQFPFYGGLLGWTLVRKNYLPLVLVGSLHLLATIVCFSGALSNFS